jgi:4-amino-4-deoxy-L-arabinose transferase-like glycosyltransferase
MWRTRAGLFVALVVFLGLSSYQPDLPGLHYDEVVELVPAMQLLADQPVTTFRGNGVWLGDRLWPLMTQDYIGALNTYLALPVFLAFGVGVVSARLMALAVAVITLVLAYQLARQLAGPAAGNLTALLLAVSPTFIFWSRQGVFVTAVTGAIGLAAALAWLRWWRTRRPTWAIAGAYLFGLGIYAKLLFLWLVFGLAVAAVVCVLIQSRGRFRAVWRRLFDLSGGWRLAAPCSLAFVMGCAPLLAYNLETGGTLSSIGSNLTTSYYGTNNLAFLANLGQRLEQFVAVLSGSHFWYLGEQEANWLAVAAFVTALGASVWLSWHTPADARVLLPFSVIGAAIIASCATVSALWVTHFAVLAPWPALAVGCTAGRLLGQSAPEQRALEGMAAGERRSGWRFGASPQLTVALVALVIAAWVGDVVVDVRYHRALTVSGGLGTHSDAIYDLAEWLETTTTQDEPAGAAAPRVAAMDWGIAAPAAFLTRGAVTPIELFGYAWESDAALATRLAEFIDHPEAVYLWRAPDEIVFDRSEQFRTLYSARGLEEDIVAAFYERSGRPVLGATRLVPAGTAANPPQPVAPR